jgi:hypothetical protein
MVNIDLINQRMTEWIVDMYAVISSRKVFPLWQDGDRVYIDVGASTGIDEAHGVIAGRQRWTQIGCCQASVGLLALMVPILLPTTHQSSHC